MWKEVPKGGKQIHPTKGQERTTGRPGVRSKEGYWMKHLHEMHRSPTRRERTTLALWRYQWSTKLKTILSKRMHTKQWDAQLSSWLPERQQSDLSMTFPTHTSAQDQTLEVPSDTETLRVPSSSPYSEAHQLISPASEHRISNLLFSTSFLNANRQPRITRYCSLLSPIKKKLETNAKIRKFLIKLIFSKVFHLQNRQCWKKKKRNTPKGEKSFKKCNNWNCKNQWQSWNGWTLPESRTKCKHDGKQNGGKNRESVQKV